jgi:hypothetical protein
MIGKVDLDPGDALITLKRLQEAALPSVCPDSKQGEYEKNGRPLDLGSLDLDCAVLHLDTKEILTCLNFSPHLSRLSAFLEPLADFPLAGPGWLEEKFRFEMPRLEMDHHGEKKTLDLSVSFRYRNSLEVLPDFRIFEREIAGFLASYPNKVDYWEIVNRKLVQRLLELHPNLEELAITIAVRANDSIGFERASTVAMRRPQ